MGALKKLSMGYGRKLVLDGIDLSIPPGGRLGVFGNNGAGKTTLGRLLTGLEKPSGGSLFLVDLGRPVLVQQDFVVWPHLSVLENVRISMRGNRRSPGNAHEWLERFGLAAHADAKGGELSFGQQQRVALARAFASGAVFFVFDEVFSGLDSASHFTLLRTVRDALRERQATSVWISHDWFEIAMMCDQVAVLGDGRLMQTGTPDDVYHRPSSTRVAGMTGPVNLFSADDWRELARFCPGIPAPCPPEGSRLLVRPENVELIADPPLGAMTLETELFAAPGFHQEFRFDNILPIRVFSVNQWAGWDRGSVVIKKFSCVPLSTW
jgi:ABC-type multidrug transport system ATPase subunit